MLAIVIIGISTAIIILAALKKNSKLPSAPGILKSPLLDPCQLPWFKLPVLGKLKLKLPLLPPPTAP